MKKGKAKRAIVMGFDGAIPGFVQRFRKELPHLNALMKKGVFSFAVPSYPTDTPTNWTTIATGALTGTHGIVSFTVQNPDESFGQTHWTFNSNLCKAEYIWQTLERAGMRSILVNYPTAFPVKTKKSLIVGGNGIFSPDWTFANSALYSTETAGEPGTLPFGYRANILELKLRKAEKWMNMVSSYLPPLEASIEMLAGVKMDWSAKGAIAKGKRREKEKVYYHILIYASEKRKYDTLLISKEKDAKKAVAILKEGKWSDWIYDEFSTSQKEGKGFFCFRLITLSPDGKLVKLFRSDIGDTRGWSYPSTLADELIENVGPFLEGAECPVGVLLGWFPVEVGFEQVRRQANYLVDTSRYLARKNDWNLLAVQIHIQDFFNHVYLGYLYSDNLKYSKKDVDKYWDIFLEVYKITDEMVGKIIRECGDEDTLIIVLSDHGAVPVKKTLRTLPEFMKAGLVTYKKPDKDGICGIDFSRTKVFAGGYFLWVNLKGRNPDGIVNPGKEFEEVRDKIIKILYSIVDPETGRCPFEYALKKEHAAPLGIWGERMGDVIPIVKPAYSLENWFPCQLPEKDLKRITEDGSFYSLPNIVRDPTGQGMTRVGEHSNFWPDASVGDSSCCGLFIMAGPGVKKNYINKKLTMSLADVAPTITHLIGAPCPKDADGKILSMFLE